jgi:hypothetical protein
VCRLTGVGRIGLHDRGNQKKGHHAPKIGIEDEHDYDFDSGENLPNADTRQQDGVFGVR